MRIQLIRHGQTPMNVAQVIDTAAPGAPLTELGHEQAARLPDRLGAIPLESIYVSNLIRTQQTAAPLAVSRGMDPVIREGIREIQAGTLEMGDTKEDYDAYFRTIVSWFDGDLTKRMGGLESGHEVLGRFDDVVREIEETGASDVALVSHGGVIVLWAGMRAAGLSADKVIGHHPENTGICVVEGSLTSGFRAVSWMGDEI